MQINSSYIHQDQILVKVYNDAVNKFMAKAENEICFSQICEYVHRKLIQKKQCAYSHSLMIVKEVCQRIGENFDDAISFYAFDAKNYRDIYYSVY